ncbi:extracellular matrix protein 1 [Polymixia lowei]
MDWSWALVCSCAFVLVFITAASEDEPSIEQREVTFDIDAILREMNHPEPVIMQKEVDLADLFETIEQIKVTSAPLNPDLLKAQSEKGWPRFGPRSFGGPPSLDYPVQFPPGRPTPTNLQAICLHGDRRPRYPDTYFPQSGFGQLKRRATAVNHAESLFSMCCKGNQNWDQEVTLCCVRQAWRLAVDSFCKEDTSVKDRVYHCCKIRGNARLNCFQSDAPNPAYQATEEVTVSPVPSASHFPFDPNTCQRSELTPGNIKGRKQRRPSPSTPQNISISFPPGRPSAADIESLCRYRKLRPRYDLKCLPNKGYGWLARQSKTINRVEKGFKQCCKRKQEVLTCADGKWREEMDRYCREEKGGKLNFPCCEKAEDSERYECFHARAPHPGYDVDLLAATAASLEDPSLGQICETHKIIKKKSPVGFPLQGFVDQCCPLSSEQRSSCIQEKVVKMSKKLCSARKASSTVRQCCHISSQSSSQCFSNILMNAITKATNTPRLRKRKCPLS